jgi:hypothetical protein
MSRVPLIVGLPIDPPARRHTGLSAAPAQPFPGRRRKRYSDAARYSAACSTYSPNDAWYSHAMAAAICNSTTRCSTNRIGYRAESIDRRSARFINRI